MNWNDIGNNIWSLVSAIGGVSVIIVGLSVWIGNILANRFTEKFRLASEQQIKLIEAHHAKEMSELQFDHDKKLDEQKQRLQFEFDAQRQTLQIEAAQNMRFLEKQFDLYLLLWDKLQELSFAGDKLWDEASLDNLVSFTEAYQQTRLVIDKVSLVMDENNFRMLKDVLRDFERFRIGKRNIVELRTGNSVKLAYSEYVHHEGDIQQFQHEIKNQVEYNRFHRDRYLQILENIRQELQVKLAGNPLAENLRRDLMHLNRFR